MDKKNYYNTINLQIEDLKELASVQVEKCFDLSKLSGLMDADIFKNLKRVIITGCGDSYSAAGAMLPAFRMLSGIDAAAPDPMEFCRFYSEQEVKKGHDNSQVLVVAVSASGGSDRIVEIVTKGRELGVGSMLISNNPESKGAKAAGYMYHVETPPGCNSPGLRSYFASMVAILALGAYIGLAQGRIDSARFEEIKKNIVGYVNSFLRVYDSVDSQMFDLSLKWKGFEKFEAVGDSGVGFSAQFVEEKFIECAGVHCTHADAEDWCHINYFLRDPETIGTIIMVHKNSPDFDRMIYTIRSAVDVGRPTLVVTDAEVQELLEGVTVCTIPQAPEIWMTPLVDFAPGSLLGAYVAAVSDKLFFGGRYDFRTQKWNI